jgi:hypothetical protein
MRSKLDLEARAIGILLPVEFQSLAFECFDERWPGIFRPVAKTLPQIPGGAPWAGGVIERLPIIGFG